MAGCHVASGGNSHNYRHHVYANVVGVGQRPRIRKSCGSLGTRSGGPKQPWVQPFAARCCWRSPFEWGPSHCTVCGQCRIAETTEAGQSCPPKRRLFRKMARQAGKGTMFLFPALKSAAVGPAPLGGQPGCQRAGANVGLSSYRLRSLHGRSGKVSPPQ